MWAARLSSYGRACVLLRVHKKEDAYSIGVCWNVVYHKYKIKRYGTMVQLSTVFAPTNPENRSEKRKTVRAERAKRC